MKNARFNSYARFANIKNASIALLSFIFIGFYPSDASAQAGSFDESFHSGLAGGYDGVSCLLILPDDKILIGGDFKVYDGASRNGLAKIEANGELDTGFSIGSGFDLDSGSYRDVHVIKYSGSESYYIGGSFDFYNGIERRNIVRIHPGGSIDTSFDPGSGPNSIISDITNVGTKIMIGGAFTSYDGNIDAAAGGLCRVNPDGNLDQTFVSLLSANSTVKSIHVDNNHYAYIGGDLYAWDGQSVHGIIKLLPNGDLDPGFEINSCNNFVTKVFPSGDGNFYIIGYFTEYDGFEVNKIAKITPQGALIHSFDVGSGPDYYINDAVVQSDGKIILVGDFNSFNGVPAFAIVRLMPDGSVDPTFISGMGIVDATISACALQSDGKIIIVGNFIDYDGNPSIQIARIHNDLSTNISKTHTEGPLGIYPNPAAQSCSISGNESNTPLDIAILDIHGRVVKSLTTAKDIDTSDLVKGLYVVQILDRGKFTDIKLVVN